jgi:SAM-dependent methyltransferase
MPPELRVIAPTDDYDSERLHQDTVEWDVANWSLALTYWERHTRLDLSRSLALEIGSRHGGLSLWMALKGATVWCTDVNGPTDDARRKHARYGTGGRINYRAVDALHIPFEECFDLVMFKSVLGAVGAHSNRAAQRAAIAQMHRSLKPGGELFFAENLQASPIHRFARRAWVPWGQRWRYVTIEEMLENLSEFASVEYGTAGFLGAFGRGPRQRRWLAGLDQRWVDRMVPAGWRYIVFWVARK